MSQEGRDSELGHKVASLRYASAPDRRECILELVNSEGFCTIAELSASLGVSEGTVRRDVRRLERDRGLRPVRGGVTLLPHEVMSPRDFTERAVVASDVKRQIAQTALSLLERGATVGVDSGTTTCQLAFILPENLGLTVASHSLPALVAMGRKKGLRIIGIGGELHPETQDFAGLATCETIANLRLSLLFLGAGGLTERGVFVASDHEALVKRRLLEVAEKVVLLADSTKFTTSAMVRVCELNNLDVVVTDSNVADYQRRILTDRGIEVMIAGRTAQDRQFESDDQAADLQGLSMG